MSGLNAESVQLDDADEYFIAGEPLQIGSGGLTASPGAGSVGEGGAFIEVPVRLGAPQTWHISGRGTGEVGENGILLGANAVGAHMALNLELANGPLFVMAENNIEAGPVSIVGANSNVVTPNGVLLLAHAGINAVDGEAVNVSHAVLSANGAVGRLTTSGADLDVGSPAGHLQVATAKLDPSSRVAFHVIGAGATPQTDYSQLLSNGGGIELQGAKIEVVVRPPAGGASCPILTAGQTYTFVSTTGTLSGAFANAPENGPELPIVFAGGCTPKSQAIRITYHEAGVTQTVTGTVEEAAAKRKQEEEATRKREEESTRKKREEEEAAQTRASEEARKQLEAESLKKRQEAEAAGRKEQEASAKRGQEEEAQLRRIEALIAGPASGSAGTGALGSTEARVSASRVAALLGAELTPAGAAAKITTLLRSGGYADALRALEPGTTAIAWYGAPFGAAGAKAKPILMASGRLDFSAAGRARIGIRLTTAGRRLLSRAKRVAVTARGTFTPSGQMPVVVTKKFVLKR